LAAVLVVGVLQGLRRDEPDPAIANERIVDALDQIGYNHFASVKVYRHLELDEAARSSRDVLRRVGFDGQIRSMNEEGKHMSEKQQIALDELISTLKQQRDELKLKLHLGKAELRDEWNALDEKLRNLGDEYEPANQSNQEVTAVTSHIQ
jgi:hypothetical protein